MRPKILTEDVYYKRPKKTPQERRQREREKLEEVQQYLAALGFRTLLREGSMSVSGVRDFEGQQIIAGFCYREDSGRVRKSLVVTRDNRLSNVRLLHRIELAMGFQS